MGEGVLMGEGCCYGDGTRRGLQVAPGTKGRAMMGDPWQGVLQGPGAYNKTGGLDTQEYRVTEYTSARIRQELHRGSLKLRGGTW